MTYSEWWGLLVWAAFLTPFSVAFGYALCLRMWALNHAEMMRTLEEDDPDGEG